MSSPVTASAVTSLRSNFVFTSLSAKKNKNLPPAIINCRGRLLGPLQTRSKSSGRDENAIENSIEIVGSRRECHCKLDQNRRPPISNLERNRRSVTRNDQSRCFARGCSAGLGRSRRRRGTARWSGWPTGFRTNQRGGGIDRRESGFDCKPAREARRGATHTAVAPCHDACRPTVVGSRAAR